jgi:hypothetical protein
MHYVIHMPDGYYGGDGGDKETRWYLAENADRFYGF